MRSFWAGVGRLGCHCHCYSCIESRHVHVRKLSAAASRIRSGRHLDGSATQTAAIASQRRHFRRPLDPLSDIINARNAKTGSTRLGSREEHENAVRKRSVEEQDLKEVAGELKSLSIDHWSLDDVVNFEPSPGGPRPPVVPSTTKADPNYMMPQSPWAPDALKRQNYARVWTRKKIAKMETAVARLVLQVCRLFRLQSQPPSNLLVLPEAIRPFARLSAEDQDELEKQFIRRMRMLANRDGHEIAPNEPLQIPEELQSFIPKYEHFEDGLHHELLRDLNASLVELFDGYKHKQLDFLALMLKSCHNLLVSSAPPNVQTMNILLLGLYSSDKYVKLSASQVRHLILDWLIAICLYVKIRPNEITCSTVLATYRRRGMRNAFTQFVMLMRGTTGKNALMFTKPISITPQNAPRLTPTTNEPNIFKQSVYPSPMVFAEVIMGVAKFYRLQDAITLCKDFTAREWGYDWACLRYLLQHCIFQEDWEAGQWVWSEIKAFRAAGHEEPVSILAAMLALCVRCQQEKTFAEVLNYAMSQGRDIDQPEFTKLATGILSKAIDRMDEEQLLALKTSDDTIDENGEERSVYGSLDFELRVRRRLADDPQFRRAVIGFGSSILDMDKEMRYLDHMPDRSESYHFRRVSFDGMQDDTADEDAQIMRGAMDNVHSRELSEDEPDLLSEAAGGFDVQEDDATSFACNDEPPAGGKS